MEISKLLILLCCATLCLGSHHGGQVIPVEGYESELQDLGEHVEVPEAPVRVIKITKTVAVKVPVPYPVKVIEKVPYPVHVNKPYPVPVPQIIRVPYEQHGHQIARGHEALDVGHAGHAGQFQNQHNDNYQVQENVHDGPAQESYGTINHGGEENDGNYNAEEPHADYYGHGSADEQVEPNSYESKNYQSALQNYFNRLNQPGHLNNLSGH